MIKIYHVRGARSVRPIWLCYELGAVRLLRGRAETAAAIVADAEQKIRTCLEVVDHALADREFLLGSQFDAADVMMGYSLALMAGNRVLDGRFPHASAYLTRLRGRAACKRAMSA